MLALNKQGLGCLGVIVLLICALVGAFDRMLTINFLKQRHAQQTYVPVEGEVISSYVQTSYSGATSGGGGTTHRCVVEYAYEVNGARYENDRYSFVQLSTGDRRPAQAIVDRHPEGSVVTVYHDPDDPKNSVIDITKEAFDAVLFLFLIPFNCFAIGMIRVWFFALRNIGKTPEQAAVSSMVVSQSTSRTILKDQRWGLVTIYLIALGASGFVATFVVLFGFGGFNAPARAALIALLVCGVLAAIITAKKATERLKTMSRLVLDYDKGTFERLGGTGAHPIASVKKLHVKSVPRSKSKKKNREAWYTHEYAAELTGGERVKILTSMGHKDQRKPVNAWLEQQLALSDA